MIRLNFLEVCENCPRLEVVNDGYSNTTIPGEEIYVHKLTCKNIDTCREMLEYLKKEVNKNGK